MPGLVPFPAYRVSKTIYFVIKTMRALVNILFRESREFEQGFICSV